MTRLFLDSVPVTVSLNPAGEPLYIEWPERQLVLEVCARWRVDDDWWRLPISRRYYKLRTEAALIEVYQDLITGGWFLERIHD